MNFLEKIFGSENEKYLKKIKPLVEQINSLEKELENLPDLKEKTLQAKDNLPLAFALVREAAKRTLKQRHFDVQLLGAIVLHEGKIAEMRTGEGKTLASTPAIFLNALDKKGVHVITVNDYLAKRDAVWMGQIFYSLGLSVGCIAHDQSYLYDPSHIEESLDQQRDILGGFKIFEKFLRPVSRKQAYEADITYGTNNEFAFDYLRDNLAQDLDQKVQRGFNFVIIDEVDSILIDEARTPLIISGPGEDTVSKYYDFAKIINTLKEQDYELDEKLKAAIFTEKGQEEIIKQLGLDPWEQGDIDTTHHLEAALKARSFFQKDKDYVVKDGQIIIVDEFTGRLMPGRRWSGGLHQAIEAKEGVKVQPESKTYASISFQNYFRMYKKLAGMTGTAVTSAEEFDKTYKLEVVIIPTNKPMIRKDFQDKIFKSEQGKFKALVQEIKKRHEIGQPLLVGTVSIEKNEYLGQLLQREGIVHQILNAKNHEQEGQIIAQAGKLKAVTIATNMAGRGVDIVLGGNPPQDQEKIKELGGLHVIGTERHEARRIDNQLRGRAGRQGDPGSSQFFVSTEDYLMRVFGGDRIGALMNFLKVKEDEPIEAKMISNSLETAQSKIEGHYYDARKHLLEYDDVMNKHREVFYKKRDEVLQKAKNNTLKDFVLELIKKYDYDEKEYLQKRQELEQEIDQIEKYVFLQVLDYFWMNHLTQMDRLRDAVRLRAYGQRDPLVEYKSEGHKMFKEFLANIEKTIIDNLFKVQKVKKQENVISVSPKEKVGRNEPCPCGAKYADGRSIKYKHCHGKNF
ncbi:MAG: preprotein translocase subunit SecA [Candidatus Pacebacteria bacterium]|nr:preprotein translocase subunit SecA [Candidatus Paceibacterota bacterium]